MQEMSGHQETIEELEEGRDETQAREASAEESLKASKKEHAKRSQALNSAEKVRLSFVFSLTFTLVDRFGSYC
jgi:hypothetical protein